MLPQVLHTWPHHSYWPRYIDVPGACRKGTEIGLSDILFRVKNITQYDGWHGYQRQELKSEEQTIQTM